MGKAVRRTRFPTVAVGIAALVGSLLVPFAEQPAPAYADPPAPSSITLVSDVSAFDAGDMAHLTAETDVTVTGTGQTIRIFDDTTSTELQSCTTGAACEVDVQFFTGDPHVYVATVGVLESDPVEVARTGWVIDLTADSTTIVAGDTAELTASTNQDVGETNSEYEIFIFDVSNGELLHSCSTGDECIADTEAFYQDSSYSTTFVAYVGAAGSPTNPGEVEDVQAASDPVTVDRASWTVDITTDVSFVSAGDSVEIEVTTDQDVGETNGMYAIHIFDAYSGDLVETCTTGSTCSATFEWTGAGYGIVFVGYVAANDDPADMSEVADVLGANGAPVNIDQWDVVLDADKADGADLAAGEDITLTATADQNLGDTSGELSLYILDWAQGKIVKTCTTGTECIDVDRFYETGDEPYVGQAFAAVVSDSGITDPNEIENFYGYGDGPTVYPLSWIVDANLTGGSSPAFEFTVTMNQNLSLTNNQLALYLFNSETGEFEDSCLSGSRCILTSTTSSSIGYSMLVADRTAPPSEGEAENVRGGDGVSWTALVDGKPVYGPVLLLEGIGGRNLAQKACQCAHADPVNTATGEYYENLSDMSLPGIGPALSIERSYSTAKSAIAGPFGFGWSTNLDAHIEVLIPGDVSNPLPRQVQVVQENGSTTLYTRGESTDDYVALGRVQATLEFDDGSDTWIYVRGLVETLTFNDAGLLVSKEDLNGNELTVTRDGGGKVISLEGAGGRELAITWTGDRITSVTDSASRTVSYAYDGNGDLSTATAIDGAVASYTYDDAHRILTITKPGGGVITNTYDGDGRVISQVDPVMRETTFAYSAPLGSSSLETTITYPDASVVVEQYANGVLVSQTRAAGTAYEATTLNSYDADLNVTSTTDPAGALTTFTHNDDGRMLTQTDALDRTTSWTYDSLGNVTSVTDPLSRETTYTYDGDGNLLSVEHPGGGIEEWTYNGDGTIATYEDARGKVTKYAYTAEGWVESVEDPVGAVTTSVYNDAGFAVSTTDALLHTSEMTRDATGRVLTSTDPLDRTTTTTYDADGNLTSATDPEGGVTSATFDVAGQRTSKTDATSNVTTYTYTLGGQLATTTQPGSITSTNSYNALGQLISTTDPLGRVTTFEYDTAGNLTTTTRPSGAEITDTYDLVGQLISRTDAAGEITTFEYDDAGQLISTTDPLDRETVTSYTLEGWVDTVTLPDSSEILYDYDAAGNVTEVTDADGYVTTNVYDDAGRLVETERPGSSVTTYAYSLLGQLTVQTVPDSTTLTYDYDATGQLIEIDPSLTGAIATTYSYDDAGRRVGVVDSTGNTTVVYDAAGRLTSETDGNGNTVGYNYDALGRVSVLTYPSADTVTYAYNAASEMVSLTDWNSNTISFTWTLDGELATRSDPNGVTTTRGYSTRGELTSIDVDTSLDDLLSIAYGYDDAGQLVSREFTGDAYPDSAAEYEYDELGQLAATDYSGDYESSSGGQLLHLANGSSLGYDNAQHLEDITPDAGPATEFTYNDNGARINATAGSNSTDYEYDAYGALVAVDDGTSAIEYEVDGSGLRRTRTEGVEASEFAWATRGSIPLLLSGDDFAYVYGPGSSPVAQVTDTDDIEYLYADIVGSSVLLANDDATVTGYYEYSEYGAAVGTGGTLSTAMQYTGNWADPITGLLYLRARDYDPLTGQFISVDPLVGQTRQPYAYAMNNPLLLTDPSGLFAIPWPANPALDLLAWFTDPMAVIPGWALGYSDNDETFGNDSVLGQHLLGAPETREASNLLAGDLLWGQGNGTRSATYSAGSNMYDNLSRDIGTYLHPSMASPNDRLKAALGSYTLEGRIVSVDEDCRTAMVEYNGANRVTLGSALGFKNPELTLALDVFALMLPGPFLKPVNQKFQVYETISY